MDFKNFPFRAQVRATAHIVNSIETDGPQGMFAALNRMLNGGVGKTVMRLFGDHYAAPTVVELLGRIDSIPGTDYANMIDRVKAMVHLEHATELEAFIHIFIALTIYRRYIHSGMDRDEAANITAMRIQQTIGLQNDAYSKFKLTLPGQFKNYVFEGIDQCHEEMTNFKKEAASA